MSTSTSQHPAAADVAELMGGLFGLSVTAVDAPDANLQCIAEYLDHSGAPIGYLACDLAGGCRLGAALTQVPAGRVDEAVKDGAVPDALAENLDEIFNICVNLIVPAVGSRVTLGTVVHGRFADGFDAFMERMDAKNKCVYGLDITRYGTCRMVIAF